MSKIIIFGTDTMAELAHFYFTKDAGHEITAFTADKEYIKSDTLLGKPILPFENIEKSYPPAVYQMFIAIGYKKLNKLRAEKYQDAKEKGYKLISFIHSRAIHYDDLRMGDNCFILENQVLQPKVSIGSNVFLWSGNHFGHDVEIGNHTFLSSQVVCCGGVKIGKSCFIGANVTLRDGVTIGNEVIISAGSLILKDIPNKTVIMANATPTAPLDSEKFVTLFKF